MTRETTERGWNRAASGPHNPRSLLAEIVLVMLENAQVFDGMSASMRDLKKTG